MIAGVLVFVMVITPFVTVGRYAAFVTGADSSATREQAFAEILTDPEGFLSTKMESIDIPVLFRGIYPLAGELTRRNGLLEGEWHGETIAWGFETLLPRALAPNKRDTSIGNFFGRTVGADIGVSGDNDYANSIALSLPFEFLGNYG